MPTESSSIPPAPGPVAAHAPLRRARDGRALVGVCAGLARPLGVSPLIVRLIALVIAVASPALALVGYAALAVLMPRDDGRSLLGGDPDDRRETMIGWALIAVAVIAAIGSVGSSLFGGPGSWVVLAAGAALLAVHHLRNQDGPARPAPAPTRPPSPRRTVEMPYPGPAARMTAAVPAAAPAAVTAAPRAPRGPSIALYGVAAVLAAGVVAVMLGTTDAVDFTGRGVALMLGAGALALTAAAVILARRRGAVVLVVLAALLGLGAAGAAAVGDHADHGVGERTRFLIAPSDLSERQRFGIGSFTVDVAPSALRDGTGTLDARLGIGELVVRVPAGVRVISVGPTELGGLAAINDRVGLAPLGTLRVSADVEHGSAEVELAHR